MSELGFPDLPAWNRSDRIDDADGRRLHRLTHRRNPNPAKLQAFRDRIRSSPSQRTWTPIGPTVCLDRSGRRVAGRVRDLAVSADGRRVYALGGRGGLWGSLDGGDSWTPLSGWTSDPLDASADPEWPATAGGALLVRFDESDPTSPADAQDEIFIGTGEPGADDESASHSALHDGDGVLRAVAPLQKVHADPFARPWTLEAAAMLGGQSIFRMADEPGASTDRILVAASTGLALRSQGATGPAQWAPVDLTSIGDPFRMTDVAWINTSTPGTHRIWAVGVDLWDNTAATGKPIVMTATDPNGPWQHANLAEHLLRDLNKPPGHHSSYLGQRLCLAITDNPDVVWVMGSDLGHATDVWRVERSAATLDVAPVGNVPPGLNSSIRTMAFAHAELQGQGGTTRPMLFLGGRSDDDFDAMVYRCEVRSSTAAPLRYELDFDPANNATPTKDATWIGKNVHVDTHRILVARRPLLGGELDEVWVCSDGGVDRSVLGGCNESFVDRNVGLANLETGSVDGLDGRWHVGASGTQDNGVLHRIGYGIWQEVLVGDGGGVQINPDADGGILGQHARGSWRTTRPPNTTWEPPPGRQPTALFAQARSRPQRAPDGTITGYSFPKPIGRPPAQQDEEDEGRFYSKASVRVRSGSNDIALGVDRVWLGRDWQGHSVASWVVLPDNVDPYGPRQRKVNGLPGEKAIASCRWVDDHHLITASPVRVAVYAEDADPAKPWTCRFLESNNGWNGDLAGRTYLPFAPCDDLVTDVMGVVGANGITAYLARASGSFAPEGKTPPLTTASQTFIDNECLWWCNGDDGDLRWYPTGLGGQLSGHGLGAFSIATVPSANQDPSQWDLLVGTSVGVWRGTPDFGGTDPSWSWVPFSDGLPSSEVHDVGITTVQDGGTDQRLVRAALPAYGVWETELDRPSPPHTFVRVHARDTRRPGLTFVGNELANDHETFGRSHADGAAWWFSSPDVRLVDTTPAGSRLGSWPSPQAFLTVGFGLAWSRFASALREVLPVPPMPSEAALSAQALDAFRRVAGLPTPASNPGWLSASDWNGLVAVAAANPDLIRLGQQRRVGEDAFHESAALRAELQSGVEVSQPLAGDQIQVLVHHRGLQPVAADSVRVLLLVRAGLPFDPLVPSVNDTVESWLPSLEMNNGIRREIVRILVDGDVPDPAKLGPWTLADGAQPVRHPMHDLDARAPAVAKFDFTPPAGDRMMLLAVVSSDPDPVSLAALPGSNARELVLGSRHCAALALATP